MVTVFFESKSHAEQVAVFDTEELYMKCLPALVKEAADQGMIVTESIDESADIDMVLEGFNNWRSE